MYSLEIHQLAYKSRRESLLENTQITFEKGKMYGLSGPSGIGKSTLLMSLADLQDSSCIAKLKWINKLSPRISFMSQQPGYTLNPIRKVGRSLRDVFKAHAKKALEIESILAYCSLLNKEELFERYPHQCSGGELQRIVLAMGLSQGPDLLLLDEPTAGIDQLTARSVLADIQHWVQTNMTSCLIASHDENLLHRYTDYQFEIDGRKIIPTKLKKKRFHQFVSKDRKSDITTETKSIYRITNGTFDYGRGNDMLSLDVDLEVLSKAVVGLTGVSGAGKSTIGKLIAGQIQWKTGKESIRFRQVQYLSQDPVQNFHPYKKMKFQFQPIYNRWKHLWSSSFEEVLKTLQIEPDWMDRSILGLSGGQRQRVLIARALLCKPDFIIIDESFSGLDAATKGNLWKWIENLRGQWSFSVLVITHDLEMIKEICDYTYILDGGKIIDKLDNFDGWEKKALHPVTKSLINAYI